MSQNYWDQKGPVIPGVIQQADNTLQKFMMQVYTWMALGLAITGLVATYVASDESMIRSLVRGQGFMFLIILELGLVVAFGLMIRRAAIPVLLGMFLAYSALNGLTLSVFFFMYTKASLASTFFVTAGTFGAMCAIGYTTKKDLTGIGQFAMMGLIGIIIASIVNMFLRSDGLMFLTSIIGVVIFVGLTAYDTQKLKVMYQAEAQNEDALKRVALMGALTLYLDFINLFIMLLRLMGRRR